MGKSAPQAPAAPDPAATAQAQATANADTARVQAGLNRVNQVTPYGNLTYSQDTRGQDWIDKQIQQDRANWETTARQQGNYGVTGGEGYNETEARSRFAQQNPYQDAWTATQTLSPDEQAQLEASNRAIATYGRAANTQLSQAEAMLSQQFNPNITDRSGDIQRTLNFGQFGDPNATRAHVEDALFARLQPYQDRDRARLETNLANQGLTMGSEAYRAAMDDLNRGVTDQRLAVTAQGRGEQESLYNMALGSANLNNSAVGQQAGLDQNRLAQLLAVRNQPINEASALLSGSQISLPQFTSVPQVGVGQTDYLGAVGQQQAGQNAAYQGQVSTANANAQGTAAAGAAVISAAAVIA